MLLDTSRCALVVVMIGFTVCNHVTTMVRLKIKYVLNGLSHSRLPLERAGTLSLASIIS
jgi:hypothetical protein